MSFLKRKRRFRFREGSRVRAALPPGLYYEGNGMQTKEGIGWKAGYNGEKGVCGAEVVFRDSRDC